MSKSKKKAPSKRLLAIGARVKARRDDLELTQASLATKAGMYPSEVSDVETGRRGLTTERLVSLLAALDASADEILGLGAHKPAGRPRAKRARKAASHA